MKNDLVYFDTASAGLLSESTLQAAAKYDELLSYNASQIFYNFLADDLPIIKSNTAKLVGIAPERIAFAPNFSYIFSAFLVSVRKRKERVLLLENDYLSLTQPFIEQDFKISWLKSEDAFTWDFQVIEDAIKKNQIQIFAISHVQYLTGQKSDLLRMAEICKRNKVLFLVDGTQSFGAVDFHFDKSEIDVFIASNYKWMNGGYGSATACFKEGIIEEFRPIIAGYGSFRNVDGKFTYKPSVASYQPGHINMAPILGFGNAVKEKTAIGLAAVQQQSLALVQYFIDNLDVQKHALIGPPNMQNRSHIVCVQADEALHAQLLRRGIKTMFRNNSLRISFHHNNTKEDVDVLLSAL